MILYHYRLVIETKHWIPFNHCRHFGIGDASRDDLIRHVQIEWHSFAAIELNMHV